MNELQINDVSIIINIIGIIIGGIWVIWKFSIKREAHPKVQFDLECELIGIQKDHKLIQITALIENKGSVRHSIDGESFQYKIRYITENNDIKNGFTTKTGTNINQINFQNRLNMNNITTNRWTPLYSYTFIDPRVIQKYTAIIALPINANFILIQSQFKYQDLISDEHSSQKVFNIKNNV